MHNEKLLQTMNFPNTLILNGGLFDFDLTFVVQAVLFIILALVTTNVFFPQFQNNLMNVQNLSITHYVKQQFY